MYLLKSNSGNNNKEDSNHNKHNRFLKDNRSNREMNRSHSNLVTINGKVHNSRINSLIRNLNNNISSRINKDHKLFNNFTMINFKYNSNNSNKDPFNNSKDNNRHLSINNISMGLQVIKIASSILTLNPTDTID